jgi:hypothetical protein
MSENTLHIEAFLNDSADLGKFSIDELKNTLVCDIGGVSETYTELDLVDRRLSIYIEFFDGYDKEIKRALQLVRKFGFSTSHAKLFLESSGETALFKIFDNKLMKFESKKDFREHIEDGKSLPDVPFDFGRSRLSHTCIVRLRVKAKSRRSSIYETFKNCVGKLAQDPVHYQKFVNEFSGLIKPKEKDQVEWCQLMLQGQPIPETNGPSSLIKGLVFVEEFGTSLYLGFDLTACLDLDFDSSRKLYSPAERQFQNFYWILKEVSGVSKVWFKIHPGDNVGYELYGCNPGMGDSPTLFGEKVSPEHFYRVFRG